MKRIVLALAVATLALAGCSESGKKEDASPEPTKISLTPSQAAKVRKAETENDYSRQLLDSVVLLFNNGDDEIKTMTTLTAALNANANGMNALTNAVNIDGLSTEIINPVADVISFNGKTAKSLSRLVTRSYQEGTFGLTDVSQEITNRLAEADEMWKQDRVQTVLEAANTP